METPYLDQEIKCLKKWRKENIISFYQHKKLNEYLKIKKQLKTQTK